MKPTATTIYRDSAPRRRTFRPALAVLAASSFWISAIFAPKMAASEETPTFTLEMKDGVLTPDRIEIPADTTVKIIIRNTGTTPAEFESLRLRKEKVLGPGVESFIVIRRLSPGEYPFFDEFHMETGQGVIIAR
ncbi:MAG TPA: cupredoxin domain-containing protein [Hyphomicrobiales bacterium]|nr:cupredoxin domain-containing protein [Rhodobiaceae bacterium]HXK54334.1 cupredoxin domain-containing protein [Hyphomicrobiales bacterium]